MTFLKKSSRLPAAFLQLGMISGLRHAQTMPANPTIVTLLCESQ
jgi:hypothetical protein